MANLLGQNIGTNYKGILNLSTLNGNLSGTLQAVTDGDGNASPLRLSTTRVDVGTFVPFGGITNAFPALKRNGAALEVRLADDSGFANLSCALLSTAGIALTGNITTTGLIDATTADLRMVLSGSNRAMVVSSDYSFQSSASAIFEVKSTTKGFLPPRMTTAQRDAIASPAAGLVIYNTTTNVMNFFNGTVWGAF